MKNEDIKQRFSLFDVTGVELEYMIVDKDTLDIMPISESLLHDASGDNSGYFENGRVAWSNELVTHVIELKTAFPAVSLGGLDNDFPDNIKRVNQLLEKYNGKLMPGGAHPWMNPKHETRLWESGKSNVYSLYNSIFDCMRHGWSNLQSTHINLPVADDEEFGRLHAAIRLILPLLPAIAASSPLLNGELSGFMDSRLECYRNNQSRIPSIVGSVIPEAVFSEADYYSGIYKRILSDIKPFDKDGVLKHHFLNSRDAIARFDRGAIEIRLLDIQECPSADLAIIELIISLLKRLIDEEFISYSEQKKWHESDLSCILLNCINDAENALIESPKYLSVWGIEESLASSSAVWKHLFDILKDDISEPSAAVIKHIIDKGTLSTRIIRALNGDYSRINMQKVYNKLCTALESNQLFG